MILGSHPQKGQARSVVRASIFVERAAHLTGREGNPAYPFVPSQECEGVFNLPLNNGPVAYEKCRGISTSRGDRRTHGEPRLNSWAGMFSSLD